MPSGESFFNPYRIVKQPDQGPDRRYAPDLRRMSGYQGRLECLLEVYTPLEVNSRRDKRFHDDPLIPGSSLKGALRAFAELVGRGCVSIGDKNRNEGKWRLCTEPDRCCPTCDMFGRLVHGRGGPIHRGKVRIGDARPTSYGRHQQIQVLQGTPKEKHRAFYPESGSACYRKLYHHQPSAAAGLTLREKQIGKMSPAILFPVAPGSVFVFDVFFEGLDAAELGLLAYVLELEPGLLHKLGRGKSRGLGSVKTRVRSILVEEPASRYRGAPPLTSWPTEVAAAIAQHRQDRRLDQVRKMTSWQAATRLTPIRFPIFRWFKENSQVALREVDQVIPALPEASADPPLPALAKPISSRARPSAPRVAEAPTGYDPALWASLPAQTQVLVQQILRLRSYKAESAPFLATFDKAGEPERKAMIEAFRLVVPAKEWGTWAREKLQLPEAAEQPTALSPPQPSSDSLLEEALALLGTIEKPGHIRKKIMAKRWPKLAPDEQATLKRAIEDWCREHGCLEELTKIRFV